MKRFNVQPNYKAGKWQQNKRNLFHVKQFYVGKGFNLSPSEKNNLYGLFLMKMFIK